MLGSAGAAESGRERIVSVDDLMAERVRDAACWHLRRRADLWGAVFIATAVAAAVALAPAVLDRDAHAIRMAVLTVPTAFAMAVGLLLLVTALRAQRATSNRFRAGQVLGLTVGTYSVRFRDHQTSTEVAYPRLGRVRRHGDVIVVPVEHGLWLLPMELFDGGSFALLQARAGQEASPAGWSTAA